MTHFSVAVEGDKALAAYPTLARTAEELGFYSFQIYEHLPYKPAWPIAFLAGGSTKKILVGPVTEPVFLHQPIALARNLIALNEFTRGRAILGLSRGAYSEYLPKPVDRSIRAVLETVNTVAEMVKKLNKDAFEPEIYVGTSGPKLAHKASCLQAVKGIVVDNLWNPTYASRLRGVLDSAFVTTRRSQRVQLIARPFTMLAGNIDDGSRKIDSILKSYLPDLVGDSPMLGAAGVTYQQVQVRVKAKKRLPRELVESLAAIGNTADILRQVDQMLQAGVDHICFGHPLSMDPADSMRKLSEALLRRFD